MRLLDKIISMGPPEFRKMPESIVSVVVDEIANYYAQSTTMEWGAEDYPYAMPPWKLSFVEWTEPARMLFPHGWEDNPVPGTQAGCICMHAAGRKSADLAYPAIRDLARMHGCDLGNNPKYSAPDSATSVLMLFPFVSPRGCGANAVGWNTIIYLNSDGLEVGNFSYGGRLGMLPQSQQQLMTARFVHICLLAFTFMNCSNIKLQDSTTELEPPKKIKRRLRLPTIKRYTLEIAGHTASTRKTIADGQAEAVMPFHLCRGHFATYTAEAKLFGKYVGRFWIPPHTKGKHSLGEIVKDYSVA